MSLTSSDDSDGVAFCFPLHYGVTWRIAFLFQPNSLEFFQTELGGGRGSKFIQTALQSCFTNVNDADNLTFSTTESVHPSGYNEGSRTNPGRSSSRDDPITFHAGGNAKRRIHDRLRLFLRIPVSKRNGQCKRKDRQGATPNSAAASNGETFHRANKRTFVKYPRNREACAVSLSSRQTIYKHEAIMLLERRPRELMLKCQGEPTMSHFHVMIPETKRHGYSCKRLFPLARVTSLLPKRSLTLK